MEEKLKNIGDNVVYTLLLVIVCFIVLFHVFLDVATLKIQINKIEARQDSTLKILDKMQIQQSDSLKY